MKLIVETDLGHDPDDFFAICYLASVGVEIQAITIVPGDPDQIAFAKFLCKQLKLDIPIGASKLNRTKLSSGGVHHELLKKFGRSLEATPDGLGKDIIKDVFKSDTEFLIIGPATNVGGFLKDNPVSISRATMQGGFLPYEFHDYDCVKIPDFEGKLSIPTFNLNGDRPAGLLFSAADIGERRFVGKHVCHTIFYDKSIQVRLKPKDVASELFKLGMDLYLARHDGKKFHDPTAAVCHLYPDVANWVRGKIVKLDAGWGTELDEDGDYIIANIDYDKLWNHIINFV
jgi:pyrimidine-specific ribonucleoside hydrolase